MRRLFLDFVDRLGGNSTPRVWTRRSALLSALLVFQGCGSFVPEPPVELSRMTDIEKVPTITVEMILAGDDVDDRISWKQAARLEASNSKAIFTMAQRKDTEPPAKVAELIRDAVKRGISALVIEPVAGSEFVEAVNDARAGGTAVVVLDKLVPGRDPSKVDPSVIYTAFDDPARRLIDGVLLRGKADGLSNDGTALVLVHPKFGPDTEARVAILTKTLEQAGVSKVERLEFGGTVDAADKALTAKLEADPKITIVVCHEELGLTGAVAAHEALKGKRKFELAGTASVERVLSAVVLTACSGIVDRNVPTMARTAMRVAVGLAKGENVPMETLVPLPYQELTTSDKSAEEKAAGTSFPGGSPEINREKPPKK